MLEPTPIPIVGIWTEEVLAERAEHYGFSVEEYKTANVLQSEVYSQDVAKAVVLFAGKSLAKTTGAQLPIDGGNERVI